MADKGYAKLRRDSSSGELHIPPRELRNKVAGHDEDHLDDGFEAQHAASKGVTDVELDVDPEDAHGHGHGHGHGGHGGGHGHSHGHGNGHGHSHGHGGRRHHEEEEEDAKRSVPHSSSPDSSHYGSTEDLRNGVKCQPCKDDLTKTHCHHGGLACQPLTSSGMPLALECALSTAARKNQRKKQKKKQKKREKAHGHGHGHGGGGGHDHGHDSSDFGLDDEDDDDRLDKATKKAMKQLWFASSLCAVFMVAEFVGGFYANSLSIMTDAAHLLSDLAGFMISIFALYMANKEPTSRLSFGFHRAEILGALTSVLLIWGLTAILVYEAVNRVRNPPEVDGKLMFFIALGGLCVNIIMGWILHQSGHQHSHGGLPNATAVLDEDGGGGGGGHGHSHGGHGGHGGDHGHSHGGHGGENINVRAAFIHALGDAIQSIGVMIAGALIWYDPSYRLADPICTFVFSIVVLVTTVRLVRESVAVLMEGVPEGINPGDVLEDLCCLDDVLGVHDLHIWALSVGKPALSVHLVVDGTRDPGESHKNVLHAASRVCEKKYHIQHITVQIELSDGHECPLYCRQ